jgi:hypothetical protein
MGLLDDAIREHLELKRRRGADPGEVAREQREALDTTNEPQPVEEQAADLEAVGDDDAVAAAISTHDEVVAGETAELDMEAVLAEDGESSEAIMEEDSLEWEMPQRGGTSRTDDAAPSSAHPE